MARSYLGIVSRHGLEWFFPEYEHAARFLVRRVYRQWPPERVCCWAVLADDTARAINGLLAQGDRQRAFEMLQARAEDLGTLLPQAPDISPPRAFFC